MPVTKRKSTPKKTTKQPTKASEKKSITSKSKTTTSGNRSIVSNKSSSATKNGKKGGRRKIDENVLIDENGNTEDTTKKKAPRSPGGILVAIKPLNQEVEKERFLEKNFSYDPLFTYKKPPTELAELERYSTSSDLLLKQAVKILNNSLKKYGTYERFEEINGGKILSRYEITNYIDGFLKTEGLDTEIRVNYSEDLVSRGSMTKCKGKPTLSVRVTRLREQWVDGLLRHEIGTHYYRSSNNALQLWATSKGRKKFELSHFNPTEEGLASLHSIIYRKEPILSRAALLYYTTHMASKLSFRDLFQDLGKFTKDPHIRWDYCLRAKRGQTDTSGPGCFSKDQVYLDGALRILLNRNKIDFHNLVKMGKVAFEDVPRLQGLANLDSEELRIPHFMKDINEYKSKLESIMLANHLCDEELESIYPEYSI